MMTPLEKTMEELESIGEENTRGKRMISRTVAASLMSVKIETKLQFYYSLFNCLFPATDGQVP